MSNQEPSVNILTDRVIKLFSDQLEADCENDFHRINQRIYWGRLGKAVAEALLLPVGTVKTPVEIEALKQNWLSGGCWDIEDTEGFEAHKQDLYIFRLETENKRMSKALDEYNAAVRVLRSVFGREAAHV